ncbi:hypothetical protein ES332_A09G107600v1 [Gossypium tomentosum]|uniref:Uncharacterized protein n=1 Tax=Gossypium tomentosum TaxID=34277 RepID=A0A5D2P152_GOSTO|nr:hypothetical protein ES332_A09G107600v1 [Gossypium tomentosum]
MAVGDGGRCIWRLELKRMGFSSIFRFPRTIGGVFGEPVDLATLQIRAISDGDNKRRQTSLEAVAADNGGKGVRLLKFGGLRLGF